MGYAKALVRPMVLYSAGRTTSYPEESPEKGLRYHPLGGGDEVGNVGIMFENDSKGKYRFTDTLCHGLFSLGGKYLQKKNLFFFFW